DMTGPAALAIAQGLLAFPLGDGKCWAHAVARMMEARTPERLWHVGPQGLESNQGGAFIQALLDTQQMPRPGERAWEALVEHLPAGRGAQLMAALLAGTLLRPSLPAREAAHACALGWARAHPSTATAMETQLRQASSALSGQAR